MKRFVFAFIAAFIFIFLWGWFYNGALLKEFSLRRKSFDPEEMMGLFRHYYQRVWHRLSS
jgi:hypothetical protein